MNKLKVCLAMTVGAGFVDRHLVLVFQTSAPLGNAVAEGRGRILGIV